MFNFFSRNLITVDILRVACGNVHCNVLGNRFVCTVNNCQNSDATTHVKVNAKVFAIGFFNDLETTKGDLFTDNLRCFNDFIIDRSVFGLDCKCSFLSWNCASDNFTTSFGKLLNLCYCCSNIFCMCISH